MVPHLRLYNALAHRRAVMQLVQADWLSSYVQCHVPGCEARVPERTDDLPVYCNEHARWRGARNVTLCENCGRAFRKVGSQRFCRNRTCQDTRGIAGTFRGEVQRERELAALTREQDKDAQVGDSVLTRDSLDVPVPSTDGVWTMRDVVMGDIEAASADLVYSTTWPDEGRGWAA